MAVAAPVLERKISTEENTVRDIFRESSMTADERHNACISANYAKLINPETTIKDFSHKNEEKAEEKTPLFAAPSREVKTESLYLVENARADADIFRADSAINVKPAEVINEAQQAEEEENEDLRPTKTTIQYKTAAVKQSVEEGTIHKASVKLGLTKKDKIIIAVALTVIIALFVLIIVNSAVISNLTSDVSVLQNTLNTVESTFEEVSTAKEEYLKLENLTQVVNDFANKSGMILK